MISQFLWRGRNGRASGPSCETLSRNLECRAEHRTYDFPLESKRRTGISLDELRCCEGYMFERFASPGPRMFESALFLFREDPRVARRVDGARGAPPKLSLCPHDVDLARSLSGKRCADRLEVIAIYRRSASVDDRVDERAFAMDEVVRR